MCVIIYKQHNKKIEFEDLSRAMQHNPNGVGVAVFNSGKWVYQKNIVMKAKKVLDIVKNRTAVIHCRFTSVGETSAKMCHPFDLHNLNAVKGYTNSLLFHNGTVTDVVLKKYNIIRQHNESDTFAIACAIAKLNIEQQRQLLKILAYETNSKFILTNKDKLFFVGNFQVYKNLIVSNTYSFEPISFKPSWFYTFNKQNKNDYV